jgi:small subunit ribosomal protein S5
VKEKILMQASRKYNYEEFEEKVVAMNRVAKVVKGGRRFALCALVAVGDRKGHIGLGYGKASEVPEAIRKAVENARKNIISVKLKKGTIPQQIQVKFASSSVLLKPATEGSGIIAGSAARAVLELAGVQDVLSKKIGSSNPVNVAKATFLALKSMMDLKTVAQRRGKKLSDFLVGDAALRAVETESSSEQSAADAGAAADSAVSSGSASVADETVKE